MHEIIYIRNGRQYRKIERTETIQKGAMHNICKGGELHPIMSPDTIGDIPANFSPDREFFNPVTSK